MKTGIYMIRNKINDKKYIGQAQDIDFRWNRHIRELNDNKHNNRYLQNAWNKYGEDNFEFTIIHECEEELLDELEIMYIAHYHTFYKDGNGGYNLTLGGDGVRGYRYTDEQRARLSEAMKEENKRRWSNPEYKAKMIEAKKGKCAKRVYCVTNDTVYAGVVEAGEKLGIDSSFISWCCNGKNITKRYPNGHHIRGLEFWFLDEWEALTEDKKLSCKKIKYGRNSVYCVTNNTIYASTVEAREKLGIDSSCISWCCNGKNINKKYPDGHHYKKGLKKDSPVYEFWFLDEYEEKFGKVAM